MVLPRKLWRAYRNPPPPPTFGQEIETRYINARRARMNGIDCGLDGSGPWEARTPPFKLDVAVVPDIDTFFRELADAAGDEQIPEPYLRDDGDEELGCHVHYKPRPGSPWETRDIERYLWFKHGAIALCCLALLKPMVCWFRDGWKEVRCRNSLHEWAYMVLDMNYPRSRYFTRRHEIAIYCCRSYRAVTPNSWGTLEIRAFETVTFNALAFLYVVRTIVNRFKLIRFYVPSDEATDYMEAWTSIRDAAPVRLVLERKSDGKRVEIERWSPQRFREWVLSELPLPKYVRNVIDAAFDRGISTYLDAKEAGLNVLTL